MSKIMKKLWIIAAIFLVSCSDDGSKNEEADNREKLNSAFLENVEVVPAELKGMSGELTLTGKVDYVPEKVINYTPLVSGVADRVFFSLGDKVQKGQTLLNIRSSELSALHSELISAASEVQLAQRELQSAQALYNDNMLAEKELLEAQTKLNQANALMKRIESDMSFYKFNPDTGTFSILAPMSGYIVDRNISSGSTISDSGEPIFTIADLSTVWIIANVYAKDLMSVREGMDVEIQLLSYPDKIFDGKITQLSHVFDPEEKILKARILMDNNDLLFKPEMSAVVKLKNNSDRKLVAIPSQALIFNNNHYFVVVEKNVGVFEIREVQPNIRGNGTIYIESGLAEGENIVIKNQLLLYEELSQSSKITNN